MPYRVELAPAAQRELRRLPGQVQERVVGPILALSEDPRPQGARKVRGEERTWCIRVGVFRVVYNIFDDAPSFSVIHESRLCPDGESRPLRMGRPAPDEPRQTRAWST